MIALGLAAWLIPAAVIACTALRILPLPFRLIALAWPIGLAVGLLGLALPRRTFTPYLRLEP